MSCNNHVPVITGNRYGHCGACHLDFMGLTAFDKHRRGPFPNGRHCIDPVTDTAITETGKPLAQWWQDDKGRWHEGARGYFDKTEETQ